MEFINEEKIHSTLEDKFVKDSDFQKEVIQKAKEAKFRGNNKELKRKALKPDEIQSETEILVEQGHRRILVVTGEQPYKNKSEQMLNRVKEGERNIFF